MTGGRRFVFEFTVPRLVLALGAAPFEFELVRPGVAVALAFKFSFAARLALLFRLRLATRFALALAFRLSLPFRLAGFFFCLLSFEFALVFAAELFSCLLPAAVFVFAGVEASPSFVGRLISTATVWPTLTISPACGS